MGIQLSLNGQATDLGGGFVVRRMLPSPARQAVGPFLFFDHFGPILQAAGTQHDVRPHPHIGLATVTYLYEGAMMHRDSLGSEQRIEPGAVNWMSAGRGIVHSERTPEDLKHLDRRLHGLQLWVALPMALEESAPSFAHTPAADIPEVDLDGATIRVLAGSAWGVTSPVQTASPTLYLDVRLVPGQSLDLPRLADELAVYVVDGTVLLDGDTVPSHSMAVLEGDANTVRNAGATEARLAIVGGAPLDAPRMIWWNFVSSARARIARAAQDWDSGLFKGVPGDDERIELPAKRPF